MLLLRPNQKTSRIRNKLYDMYTIEFFGSLVLYPMWRNMYENLSSQAMLFSTQLSFHSYPSSRYASYRPAQAKLAPMPRPAPNPEGPRPSLTGRLATVPCALTPCTMRSRLVSITTPPIIISESVACSVSKLKIRSSSQTFSNSLSSAST